MRSPIFAVIAAATAFSPSIVQGLPTSGNPIAVIPGADHSSTTRHIVPHGLGFGDNALPPRTDSDSPNSTQSKSMSKVVSVGGSTIGEAPTIRKRATDDRTSGGNAHTGTSGNVDGGSVENGDNGGMPTIMNVSSNNGGRGGGSKSGCASGGNGGKSGDGGNAGSGDSGNANGGHVKGSAGMFNMNSNNAGDAGQTASGCAAGGNA